MVIVLPKLTGKSKQAKVTAAKTEIAAISPALDNFEVDTGGYPKAGGKSDALVNQRPNVTGWKGPYMQNVPPDPWGGAYIYDCPGKHNANGYDLMSMGPDGRAGTDDDVTNWSTGTN